MNRYEHIRVGQGGPRASTLSFIDLIRSPFTFKTAAGLFDIAFYIHI